MRTILELNIMVLLATPAQALKGGGASLPCTYLWPHRPSLPCSAQGPALPCPVTLCMGANVVPTYGCARPGEAGMLEGQAEVLTHFGRVALDVLRLGQPSTGARQRRMVLQNLARVLHKWEPGGAGSSNAGGGSGGGNGGTSAAAEVAPASSSPSDPSGPSRPDNVSITGTCPNSRQLGAPNQMVAGIGPGPGSAGPATAERAAPDGGAASASGQAGPAPTHGQAARPPRQCAVCKATRSDVADGKLRKCGGCHAVRYCRCVFGGWPGRCA